ncbi:MAG: ABC transporter substrate-binding protein [Eubacteriales bacterium]|nr:ABC transporter substrate-binding protein [Eubacteriales bacterium]
MKRTIALLIAVMLVVGLFAGCGDSETTTKASSGDGETTTNKDATGEPTDGGETDYSSQEPYTVTLMYYGDAATEDVQEVSAALSELSVAKFNTTVEISKVGFGSYLQQLNLALSSGEKLDAFGNFGMMTTFAGNGQILALDDLLANHGQDTLEAISDTDWACTTINGKIYGIPTNKDKAASYGVAFTKSMVDELDVDVNTITDLDDVYEVLKLAKEKFPNVYGMASNVGAMWSRLPFVDTLGTSTTYLGVLMDPYNNTELKVENVFASDEYREVVETMYKWNQEGLLMPDGATNTETHISMRSSGMMFANFATMKPGFDEQETRSSGTEIVSVELWPAISFTDSVSMGWSIAAQSEKPERTMQILDWLYNDFEASNITLYGVEGKHWEVKDEAKGLVGYPEGTDSKTSGYPLLTWGWLNQLNSYVWENDPEDIWEQMDEFNQTANQSPAKGFTFKPDAVINEVTACTNVVEKYHDALMNGQLNPAETIPQFVKELETAGLEKIIAEKQSQLDAWAQNQ